MKWLLFTGLILLTACSTSRLRFVKIGYHSNKEVLSAPHQSLQEHEVSTILTVTPSIESDIDTLQANISTSPIEESQKEHTVRNHKRESTFIIEEPSKRIAPEELKPKKTPEQYIKSANILLVLALVLLFVAFVLLILSITGGFGLPFLYIYLSSLILFLIGSVKLGKGYKTFGTSTGDKELLYKQYRKGKIMQIILEVFLGLWIILLVVLLILPLIKLGIELNDFLISGGINYGG